MNLFRIAYDEYYHQRTNLPLKKIAVISHQTFSHAFSWMCFDSNKLKFVPRGQIGNGPVSFQVMVWRRKCLINEFMEMLCASLAKALCFFMRIRNCNTWNFSRFINSIASLVSLFPPTDCTIKNLIESCLVTFQKAPLCPLGITNYVLDVQWGNICLVRIILSCQLWHLGNKWHFVIYQSRWWIASQG